MHRELLFPTPVYIADIKHPTLNQDLERDIIAWSKEDKGITRTNVKGWHSTTDMHERPEFKNLVNMLYACQKTVYEQEYYESEPYLGNMWANINPPGGSNRAHQHPNSLWSGVYWIKTPKNCGQLKIDDPRSVACMTRPRQKDGKKPDRLWRESHYEPVAGRCIMFPSWLMHAVDPNESNDVRISVSFNFLQKGMFV
tara:strand:+ start:137 stop:727 length:591 start_codon:yes stop_codon:yes gene_type:complete